MHMCEPSFTQNLSSLFDNLVQSIANYTSMYINWTNAQPGSSFTMPLAYMLVLDYFQISTWKQL